MVAPGDSLVGGSVEEAVDKLASLPDAIGITRFVGQIDIGGQPFHNGNRSRGHGGVGCRVGFVARSVE